jgi:hypothetical protein
VLPARRESPALGHGHSTPALAACLLPVSDARDHVARSVVIESVNQRKRKKKEKKKEGEQLPQGCLVMKMGVDVDLFPTRNLTTNEAACEPEMY